MKAESLRFYAAYLVLLGAAVLAPGQERRVSRADDPERDVRNASITGRILLPSGRSSDVSIKVSLRTPQFPITTLYTNKHGEFKFTDLPEGTYILDIAVDTDVYQPMTERLRLERGAQENLTLYLQEKDLKFTEKREGHVVTARELAREAPPAARKEYERAKELMRKGEAARAAAHLERALAIFPAHQPARNDLGVIYLKLNRLDDAARAFREAIALDPKAFNPRLNLGLALFQQKNYPEAIEHLNQAIALDGSQPAAHLHLGLAALITADLSVASRELAKAIILGGPPYSVAHYYLALVHVRRNERDEAVRELKLFLEAATDKELAAQARALLAKLK